MPVSIDELKFFQNDLSYAHFINTNLHVHTPYTSWDWDSRGDQTKKAGSITPVVFFEELNKTNLELVAITDHNCVSWCNPLIELAKSARKMGTSKLHILPGVEITSYEGPHIIAIFDENQRVEDINNMLLRLGLSGEGRKAERVGLHSPKSDITIFDIFEEIEQYQGLIIGAHSHQKDGVWGCKEFRGRTDVLNDKRLKILAAPSGEIKRVKGEQNQIRLLYKDMDSDIITNSFGFINISDCHRIDDFELNSTWLKMTTPSLNGVRQVVYEPELRVSHRIVNSGKKVKYPEMMHFTNPVTIMHPYIIGLAVTGGMLNGEKVIFSPNQNCILGKNYAGKSAILDCIRFVFDSILCSGEVLEKYIDRIEAFIGEGGEVRAYINGEDRKIFGISRTLSITRPSQGKKAKRRLEGKPSIYSIWKDEFKRESDLSIENVINIEVYPQGEVVKIKDNANQQMKIVDALSKINSDLNELKCVQTENKTTLLGSLIENSKSIIESLDRIENLSGDLPEIPQLKKEIFDLEEITKSPLFVQKKEWSEVGVLIEKYKNELERLNNKWSQSSLISSINETTYEKTKDNLAQKRSGKKFNPQEANPVEYTDYLNQIFFLVKQKIDGFVTEIRGEISKAETSLVELKENKNKQEEMVDEGIRKNVGSRSSGSNESEIIDRISEKKVRLESLLQTEQEIKEINSLVDSLCDARTEMLDSFYEKWRIIHSKREEIVEFINSKASSKISANLLENKDYTEFLGLLYEIADSLSNSSNKIANKDVQLELIASNITPHQLLDLVKNSDTAHLLELVPGVTENTARILLSMGLSDIHKIEQCMLGDKFVISYKKEGDDDFTPIDAGLSGGEQALALISVAMIPKSLPLVIDQPEDELGPSLITSDLIEQIRNIKSERQMIFVTHIPNIPVLADSEQILYIEQTLLEGQRTSKVKDCGSLDRLEIVSHLLELDGGDVAFRKRNDRYSSVIKL